MLQKSDNYYFKALNKGHYAILCILAFTSFKVHSFTLVLSNETASPINLDLITINFQKANQLFEKHFDSVEKEIKTLVTDKDCFRTGYDYVKNQVVFCQKQDVVAMGTRSVDVINHEFFHAFLCNDNPELCKENLNVPVHEGLADYFSYMLNSDKCFGENFYKNRSCIRSYSTTNRLGYVEDEHAIGNILVSDFIAKNIPLKETLSQFAIIHNEDKVFENLNGRVKSKLNRYRLKSDEEFDVEFSFVDKDLIKNVQWLIPDGVSLIQKSPFSFSLQLAKNKSIATVIATFYDFNGNETGYRKYYLGHSLNQ